MATKVSSEPPAAAELAAEAERLRRALRSPGPDSADQLRALAAVELELRALDERRRSTELEGLVRIHEALERLRACETPEGLIEAGPRELIAACGFSRAMISRVQGSTWDPEVLEVREGVDPESETFRSYVERVEIPLQHMLLETDLVRRRVPALVVDPANDVRTYQAIVKVARSTSYVVAPIMPTRRVIGFFHADRYGTPRVCDEADRDALWTFAEHFGLLFERAVLVERLEAQRSRLQAALTAASTAVDELCEAELVLVRRGPLADVATNGRRRLGQSRLDGLLTPREREVLELLASGATNAAVAQQLVVSEGTVKSHLKRIHRKLHVTNRAEAVAKYLHLVRREESQGR